MRAVLLGVLLSACGPPPEDPLVCEGGRCARVAPGVEVSFTLASIPGALEGDWLDVPGGPALLVFSHDPSVSLEIHAVRVDGVEVFEVNDSQAGVEPRLGVRPTGSPPTLIVPPGVVEVLLRASGPAELMVARFARAAPGTTLAVDVHLIDEAVDRATIEAALAEAEAILGLELEPVFVRVTAEALALAFTGDYRPVVLASFALSTRAAVNVFFVPQIADGVIGRVSSAPLSALQGEGAVAIDAGLAGGVLGLTLAHELGHALGLLHISERSGWQIEALADTPTCLVDTTGDGVRDAEDCPGAAANLMFWDPSGGGGALTEMQRARMMSSPLLR